MTLSSNDILAAIDSAIVRQMPAEAVLADRIASAWNIMCWSSDPDARRKASDEYLRLKGHQDQATQDAAIARLFPQ